MILSKRTSHGGPGRLREYTLAINSWVSRCEETLWFLHDSSNQAKAANQKLVFVLLFLVIEPR
jgi:hypothetical protein